MQAPTVRRLILKSFRSYASADLRLDNPIFVVGRNGAGKSNLLDAFHFLADAMSMPLSTVFSVRGGIANVRWRTPGGGSPPNLAISVTVSTDEPEPYIYLYGFEIRGERNFGYRIVREQCIVRRQFRPGSRFFRTWAHFDRKHDVLESSVDGLALAPEPTALALPLAGGLPTFAPLVRALTDMRTYGFSPESLREFQDPDAGLSLKRDASNAASVLQEIGARSPDDLRRIGELLEAAVPQTSRVRAITHGKKLSLEFTQAWDNKNLRFEAYNMSDGTLRLLGILLSVFQKQRPTFMGIEEPESSLHPGAVGVLLDVLSNAAERSQLLVTTQSPEVLDSELVDASNVRVVEWNKGSSRLMNLGELPQAALREHLMGAGELLRSNQLVGLSRSTRPPKMFVDY